VKAIRVIVAHPWPLLREGVRAVLEGRCSCEVVGVARSVDETVSLTTELGPEVLILDINLPGDDLFSTLGPITAQAPETHILGFMTTFDVSRIRKAAEFGVCGFVSHDTTPEKLCEAVSTVGSGRFFVGSAVGKALIEIVAAVPEAALQRCDERLEKLSEREREIFCLIARGKTNKEIAYTLGISPKTVETHHLHILRKLDVHDTVSLFRYAVRIGIVNLD